MGVELRSPGGVLDMVTFEIFVCHGIKVMPRSVLGRFNVYACRC